MAFSFLRRKSKQAAKQSKQGEKKAKLASTKQSKQKQKTSSKQTVSQSGGAPPRSSRSNSSSRNASSFASPLVTIEEGDYENAKTNSTQQSTPRAVMSHVKVMEDDDGSTEIVYGSVPRQLFVPEEPRGTSFVEDYHEDEEYQEYEPQLLYNIGEDSDEDEYDADEEISGLNIVPSMKEEEEQKPAMRTDEARMPASRMEEVQKQELNYLEEKKDERPFDESFDEPFDEIYMKKEDPYIMEIMRTQSIDKEEKENERVREARRKATVDKALKESNPFKPVEYEEEGDNLPVQKLAKTLVTAFQCYGDTATSFYDSLCVSEMPTKKRKRPYFNELFAMNFILESLEQGLPMMWHRPPSNPVDNDWTGLSMTMYIMPGVGLGPDVEHPQLVWMRSRNSDDDEVQILIDFMDIHSIMDKLEDGEDLDPDEEDLYFFSVTTKQGGVFLFECHTERERDRAVAGIKNILARLSYGLIMGDDVVTKELYGGSTEEDGDLPSLKTPTQELMTISHAFLDSLAEG